MGEPWPRALCGLFLAAALATPAALAGPSQVELTDGSVLTGDLVGYADGRYTLRSPTLGDVSLEESKVRSVRPGVTGGAGGLGLGGVETQVDLASQLQATQQRLVADPAVFRMIQALQNDPEIRGVLADPAFIALVASGNLQVIQRDPRIQTLLARPGVRAILDYAR